MVQNKLLEVSAEKLPELRQMYSVQWPKYVSSFYTIDTCIRWLAQSPQLEDVKVFCLNGRFEDDGTFIMIRGTSLFLDTLQDSFENLKTALELIDLTQPYIISSFSEHVKSMVFKVVEAQRGPEIMWNPTHFYFMSRDEALKIKNFVKIPDEITLRPLSLENADQVYDIWSCKHEDSIKYVELLIQYNPHIGAFNSHGELLAWCLRLENGTIAFLQVEEQHHRRGYGSAVVAELTTKFAEMGYDITTTIVPGNHRSINLFEKLGFKRVCDTYWIWTGPKPEEC